MEHLEGILKLADTELEAINKNGKFRSREEIDSVYKLIDIAKDVYEIWCMEEEMDGSEDMFSADGMSSYARRGGNRGGGRSYRDGSYDGGCAGNSYARGRGRNARRDSMGRYSRDGSYRGGSYRGGYSRDGKEEYIENLREMMEEAPDEQTRQGIQRMIQQMEQQ